MAAKPTDTKRSNAVLAADKRDPASSIKLKLSRFLADLAFVTITTIISVYNIITFVYFLILRKHQIIASKLNRKYAEQENPDDPCSPWRLQDIDSLHHETEKQIDEFQTLAEMLQDSFHKHAKYTCYGYRELLEEKYVPKPGAVVSGGSLMSAPPPDQASKYLRLVKLSDYKWITFAHFERQIQAAANGFLLEGVRAGDKVMLYADTRPEWQIALQALLRIKAVVCTMYASLGFDGIEHSVNETKVKLIVAQSDKVSRLLRIKSKLPTVNKVIFFEPQLLLTRALGGTETNLVYEEDDLQRDDTLEREYDNQLSVISFNRIILRGLQMPPTHPLLNENKAIQTTLDSLTVIMYTSGSTGQPKGVLISNRNILATIKAFSYVTKDFVRRPRENLGSAYLPLAHIFEFCIEAMMLYHGVAFGFATPHTLTDQSPGLMPGTSGDFPLLKPTVIIMVPLVLDRVMMGVSMGVKAKGYFKDQLVNYLIRYKTKWNQKGYDTPIVNKIICKKISLSLGGNTRFIISGSAPLSPVTQSFIRSALNIKLPQGFGTTETCAASTCQIFDDFTTGNVGPPVCGSPIKLEPWLEAGYSPTDKPNPRGEIVVGGDSIAMGYFNLPEQTNEAFYVDSEGRRWYRTGDIGEFMPNGNLKIIDRKKDLVKLQNGEYVALGKIESTLKSNPYMTNFCAYANSNYRYIVVCGPANEPAIRKLAAEIVASSAVAACSSLQAATKTSSNSNINKRLVSSPATGNACQIATSSALKASGGDMSNALADLEAALKSLDAACADESQHERLMQQICNNPLVTSKVLECLKQIASERSLLSVETPKRVMLVAEEWTEEDNLVTAAMKIRRNFIYKRYETKLQALYKE